VTLFSSKIHEDDFRREIQVANVNLAPEILQVFAHSQIFHDHKPLKTKPTSPQPATFSIGSSKVDKSQISEEKLLERLEEGNEWRFGFGDGGKRMEKSFWKAKEDEKFASLNWDVAREKI
jgi:hypothetical protein